MKEHLCANAPSAPEFAGPSRKFVDQSYLTGPIAGELLGELA
jgi:hypothetical protein